jgi:hypothetical protein
MVKMLSTLTSIVSACSTSPPTIRACSPVRHCCWLLGDARLTVISSGITRTPPRDLLATRVLYLIIGGQTVFGENSK